jgi:signal transduction histidine kinase
MQGMRERVERLGGTCEVTSTRGAGTTVTARVPLGHDAPRMIKLV